MDNASKALIMAGGILIAVMVISIAMYMIATARGVAKEANEQMEESAIESFNRYYKSFGVSGCNISGIDVVNLINKAKDDQWRYNNHSSYYNVTYTDTTGDYDVLNGSEGVALMTATENAYTYQYSDTDGDGYIDHISISKT